ncbi:hypothetical protein VTL71DRAFT_16479, partial [Oculimacula yallundae]
MANRYLASFGLMSIGLGLTSASHNAALFSYTRASIYTILFYLPLYLTWKLFLYPFYFSPLLALPQAPRENGWRSFFYRSNSQDVLRWMESVPNDGMIRYLDILNMEAIAITTPKGAGEFLQIKADQYMKNPRIMGILKNVIGNGLLVSGGADHKTQRKHLLPAFSPKVIKNLYPLFWSKASEMATLMKRDIQSTSPSQLSAPIRIDDWAGRVALDIIGIAGFGSEFSSLSNPHTELNTLYRAAFLPSDASKLIFGLSMVTTPKLVNWMPGESSALLRKAIAAVTGWVRGMVTKRQAEMLVGKVGSSEKTVQRDIISTAMNTGAFSTEDLVRQSINILAAGHETSATAVTWGIYVLSQPRYNHIQKRLREEIRANLPSPSLGKNITSEMIDNLPYLDAVSKEIMRVYAPVPVVGRVPMEDTELLGTRIPKGTPVRVHIWALNLSRKLWGEDAHEFNPERWLVGDEKANGGATDRLAYLPFGYGPRSCVGRGEY